MKIKKESDVPLPRERGTTPSVINTMVPGESVWVPLLEGDVLQKMQTRIMAAGRRYLKNIDKYDEWYFTTRKETVDGQVGVRMWLIEKDPVDLDL